VIVRGKFFGVFFVILALISMVGCAPKKVKTYESISDIRNEVVQSAVNVLGRPYRNGAKGPDFFDCSGLVSYAYKRSSVNVPVSTGGLLKAGYEIRRSEVLPGDLVFFKIKKDLHVGIMLNQKEFINASKSRGVAVDDVDANYWRKSLVGYRSILY